MKQAFASLDPQQALHVAIFIEERNAELYHRFADMFVEFRDPDSLAIASAFWEMAAEEKRHSGELQDRYLRDYGTANCAMTEDELAELIELPRLEDGEFFSAAESKRNPRDQALTVALNAERTAQEFYVELVQRTPEGPLRQLYWELSQMEDDHVSFLEQKLGLPAARKRSAN